MGIAVGLTKFDFIVDYLVSRGLINTVKTEELHNQINFLLDTVAVAHAKKHPWEFREDASETVTSTSDEYLSASSISIIRGVSLTDVGELEEIDGHRYKRLRYSNSDTSDTPRKVWLYQNRAYPYQLPTSGLAFDMWGITDVTTGAAVLALIPADHVGALQLAIDYELKLRPKSDYIQAVADLWAEESNERLEIMRPDRDLAVFEVMIGI